MYKNLKWVIFFFCFILFLVFVINVFNNEIMELDIDFYYLLFNYLMSDFVTPIALFITNLGGAVWLIFFTIILVIMINNKKIKVAITANLIIITILNILFKNVLKRPRPNEHSITTSSGYSFPSGHSMVCMAFYGFLIYLIFKYIKNKKLKWFLILSLSLLIIGIGISRIYLGVHYTSDVLGGFLFSISYLILYISIASKYIDGK